MLNVSVSYEERRGGRAMTSLLVGIAISKRSRNRERERERGKKFLLGDSVRSHSTRETRFASRSNERISTFASSILLDYLISLRKYMNEGENPIHRFIVPWNFIQQSSLLPIDEKREKNTNEWISERGTFAFSKEEGMLVNWSEATMITDLWSDAGWHVTRTDEPRVENARSKRW